MKDIVSLFLLSLLFSTVIKAQVSKSFSPAVYYTYGEYNNSNTSNGIAGYASFKFGINDLFVLGYENLEIKNRNWNYKQNFGAIGYFRTFYPFYLNTSLAFVDGKFDLPSFNFGYNDNIFIGDVNISYNLDFYFFGAGVTLQKLNGIYNVLTQFYYLKFSWTPQTTLSFSVKPGYTKTNDGREHFSLGGKIFYAPFDILSFTVAGFVGKRVSYFDPDLLMIFNQYETQINSFSTFAKLIPLKNITVIAGYTLADFTDYKINYYTFGLKYYLGL